MNDCRLSAACIGCRLAARHLAISRSLFSLPMLIGIPLPRDALILECGFLSLFFPPLLRVDGSLTLRLASAPAPLLAFSMRLLAFRLMFGFGKFKVSAWGEQLSRAT